MLCSLEHTAPIRTRFKSDSRVTLANVLNQRGHLRGRCCEPLSLLRLLHEQRRLHEKGTDRACGCQLQLNR